MHIPTIRQTSTLWYGRVTRLQVWTVTSILVAVLSNQEWLLAASASGIPRANSAPERLQDTSALSRTTSAHPSSIIECPFDVGYFRFLSPRLVAADGNHLRPFDNVSLDGAIFPAFPPFGRRNARFSQTFGEVDLYVGHKDDTANAKMVIRKGHTLVFLQSEYPGHKPYSGQVVRILGAWAPLTLGLLPDKSGIGPTCSEIGYDQENLWLQVQVDETTGWVRGNQAFRTIGLIYAPRRHQQNR